MSAVIPKSRRTCSVNRRRSRKRWSGTAGTRVWSSLRAAPVLGPQRDSFLFGLNSQGHPTAKDDGTCEFPLRSSFSGGSLVRVPSPLPALTVLCHGLFSQEERT